MAAAAAVGTLGYQVHEGQKAKRKARKESNAMKAESDRQNAEFLAQQNRVRDQKSQLATGARTALLRGALGLSDRSGGIRTTPLGIGTGSPVLGA